MKSYLKKSKKKICFFLPSLKTGGAEKVFINLSNSISNKYKVYIIVANAKGIYRNFINKNVNFINLKQSRLRYSFFLLLKILKRENFDLIFTTLPHTNIFFCIIKRIFNFKFKLFVRQSNIYNKPKIVGISFKEKIFILLMKLTYKYSDGVISAFKSVQKECETFFNIPPNKNYLIYNPIDFKKIKNLFDKNFNFKFFNKNSINIISIGRLTRQKNFESLIKCANYMKNIQKKKIKILIIGEGELYNKLYQSIKNYKLINEVKIINFVTNPFKYISKADVFVQTSLWEGGSNILVEALVNNTKVVCYNSPGGTKEILSNGKYGMLSRLNDYKDLSNNIIKAFTAKKKKKIKSLSLFNFEKNIFKYISLIEKPKI